MTKELNAGTQPVAPDEEEIEDLIACYKKKQFAQASELAKVIIKRFPEHQPTWKILGSALSQEGKVEEVLAATKKQLNYLPKMRMLISI